MSLSLYDTTVASFLQALGGVSNVMAKGEAHAEAGHFTLEEMVGYKLRADMAPFSFQVISVWHHSENAIKGMQAGEFAPPPKMEDMDYQKCKDLVAGAIEFLQAQDADSINALADNPLVFRVGGNEIPFKVSDFAMSFSLPNFYFHAATLYDMLRIHGVPLGKMDYLGQLRVGGA